MEADNPELGGAWRFGTLYRERYFV